MHENTNTTISISTTTTHVERCMDTQAYIGTHMYIETRHTHINALTYICMYTRVVYDIVWKEIGVRVREKVRIGWVGAVRVELIPRRQDVT